LNTGLPNTIPYILLRADAGPSIGMGHLMRSLALAGYLAENTHWHVHVASSGLPAITLQNLVAATGKTIAHTCLSNEQPESAFARLLAERKPHVLVLDGYKFSDGYRVAVRPHVGKLALIDDLVAGPYSADLIINHAGGVVPTQYQIVEPTRFCLGPAYALMREPFATPLQNTANAETDSPEAQVFLSLGGADIQGQTAQLAEQMADELQAFGSHLTLVVNTGPAFEAHEALMHTLSRLRARCKATIVHMHALNGPELQAELAESLVAVLPASTMAYEACTTRTPLCVLQTATNQAGMFRYLGDAGLALPCTPQSLSAALQGLLQNPALRQTLQANQTAAFDGNSGKRFREVLEELMVT